jgi:non-specific serine/threonine protein kinase/serine/threonine-protein kinase
MTPEEWQRIRPILESALELEPAARPGFLDGACQDPSVRHEVESLLASHEEAGTSLLESAPVAEIVLEEELRLQLPPGKRVGPYEIVGAIAQGGMGTVYRAIRADGQYKQQVALKIVRQEFGGEFTAARFRNERQILASLDHPNIAKILDGGTSAEGTPYFVMELIDGRCITDYCDEHKLSIDARLKLFRTVCSAVHYAHQHLVIHRDIKPSNILVTSEGVPKLLDFGIAKLLDPNLLSENVTVTGAGLAVMTPEYASPEQLSNGAITTTTDVYSLGLVLYELLAGRRAYRFANSMPHEIARAVLETDPDKPSTATARDEPAGEATRNTAPITPQLISSLRSDSPEKLRRRLSGDLDNIVLKALRKEPANRYSSADQLSDDIRRHLEGLPVLARKSSVAYRCRKYVLRHKVVVASAAIVFLSLVTGMFLTLREARIARANQLRAEKRFKDVRALANSLIFEVHDSIQDLAGATPARKLLVTKALQYLDSLSQEAAGDASLQSELAAAYERVGHVQGNPYSANLGDSKGALASYRKALAIRQALAAAKGNSRESQRDLANDYEWVGLVLDRMGDYRGAADCHSKGLTIRQAVADPSDPKSQEALASSYFSIAQSYGSLNDLKSALENYQKSAAIREPIAQASPQVQTRLAGTYGFMAPILWYSGNHAEAIEVQRKAFELMKKLSEASPENASYREFLDEAYYWTGYYQEKSGNYGTAVVSYRRALADFQALAAADPKEVRTRHYVAISTESLGTALVGKGEISEGIQALQKSLAMFDEANGDIDYAAIAYEGLGAAYKGLAAQSNAPVSQRVAYTEKECGAYQKSLELWLKVQSRGWLSPYNAEVPENTKGSVAKCEAMLKKLKADRGKD